MHAMRFLFFTACLLVCMVCNAVWATAVYPVKPITILVGYSAGGLSDTLARVIGEQLHAELGQPVLVDIRSGANSSIATAALARAQPDGYTLGIVTSNHVTNPSFMNTLPYVAQDFVGISLLAKVPIIFTVSTKATRAESLASFLAENRHKPDGVLYASAGSGNMTHLSGEALAEATGQVFTQVPYRGGGAAILDLMGGQVPSQFVGGASALFAQMQGEGGRLLRPLAVTTSQRLSALPTVPTFAELGYPQMVMSEWQALLAPAGTPAEIVHLLNVTVGKILRLPTVQARFVGVTLAGGSSEELEHFLAEEAERWSALLTRRKARQQ